MTEWDDHRESAWEWQSKAAAADSHEARMEGLAMAQLEMLAALFTLVRSYQYD